MIYLDHAAATPLDPRVLEVMEPYLSERFFNPTAIYTPAREVRREVDGCRRNVAATLGVKPGEIYFTAGATESINIGLAGVLRRRRGGKAAISAIEHSSVAASAKGFASQIITLPVDSSGRLKTGEIESLIDDETVLVSIGYVNGEIGTIQDLNEVSGIIDDIRQKRQERGIDLPLYLHTDASQAPEYLDINLSRLNVDMLTLNGGKIYGPKQSGLLYVRHGIRLEPLIYGGGQEGGIRAGTENVAAIAGLATALEIAQGNHKAESKRQSELQGRLIDGVKSLGAEINGHTKHRISGNVNASFPGINGETLVHYLDAAGIMAATGAACQASDDRPNPVLEALSIAPEAIEGSLRLSLGRSTNEEDIDTILGKLKEILPKLAQR